jgi:hypothetical protein
MGSCYLLNEGESEGAYDYAGGFRRGRPEGNPNKINIWKIKNSCNNPTENFIWRNKSKTYKVCNTKNNKGIHLVKSYTPYSEWEHSKFDDTLRYSDLTTDNKGNIYVFVSAGNGGSKNFIKKIDVNNKSSFYWSYPEFLDPKNDESLIGGWKETSNKVFQEYGNSFVARAYLGHKCMSIDENDNIYFITSQRMSAPGGVNWWITHNAIWKLSKDKKISRLCGHPSITLLGPNDKDKTKRESLYSFKPEKFDGSGTSVMLDTPTHIKCNKGYIYWLENRELIRRSDPNGNVRSLISSVRNNFSTFYNFEVYDDFLYVLANGNDRKQNQKISDAARGDLSIYKIPLKDILECTSVDQANKKIFANVEKYHLEVDTTDPNFGAYLHHTEAKDAQIFNYGNDRNTQIQIDETGTKMYVLSPWYKSSIIREINLNTGKVIAHAGEVTQTRIGSKSDHNDKQGKKTGADVTYIDIATDNNENVLIFFRNDPVEITSNLNIQGKFNSSFNYQIIADGLPQTYSLTGPLPQGLTFNATTGKITGIPTDTGKFSVVIGAEKTERGIKIFDTKILEIGIGPKITSSLETIGKYNSFLSYLITTEGLSENYDAKILPNKTDINTIGLNINSSTGEISGTLNSGGVFEIEISASIQGIKTTEKLKIYSLRITSPSSISVSTNSFVYYKIEYLGEPDSVQVLGNLPNNLVFNNAFDKNISGIIVDQAGIILPEVLLKISKGSVIYTHPLIISIGIKILNTELEKNLSHHEDFEYQLALDDGNQTFDPSGVSVVVSNLPQGLVFNPNNLLISGKITNKNITGLFNVAINITKNFVNVSRTLLIKIPPLINYDGKKIQIPLDKDFEYKIDAPGAIDFFAFGLPDGFKVNIDRGVISGKATQELIGEYFVEFSASNLGGSSSIKALFFIGANFIITKKNKTNRNLFYGKGHSQTFFLNEEECPLIYLEKGKSYTFDQSDPSNANDRLGIYLDINKKNKLGTQYTKSKGIEGVNRIITITIPEDFEEKQLYYLSETKDYVGGEIKIISKNYKLKYNLKLLIFGAKHDGEKYHIPNKILNDSYLLKNENNLYSKKEKGILAILSYPKNKIGQEIAYNKFPIRKDILNINLIKNGELQTDKFSINFFDNELTYSYYNYNPALNWKNLGDLYEKINALAFKSSGFLDLSTQNNRQVYQDIGYQLTPCQGCILKTNLITGENNLFSGQIEIYYDTLKILKNNKDLSLINTGDLKTKNFVSSDYFDFTYQKNFKEIELT